YYPGRAPSATTDSALDVVDPERLLLVLQVRSRQLLEAELAAEVLARLLRDEDLPRGRDAAQAGAGVGRVGDDRGRQRLRAADVAGDEGAGVDADADLEREDAAHRALAVEPRQPLHHLDGAADGADRVVRALQRRAEERHDPVAHELVERPVVAEQ